MDIVLIPGLGISEQALESFTNPTHDNVGLWAEKTASMSVQSVTIVPITKRNQGEFLLIEEPDNKSFDLVGTPITYKGKIIQSKQGR